jgi:hypothetical protein
MFLESINNGLPDFSLPIPIGISSLSRSPQKDLERGGPEDCFMSVLSLKAAFIRTGEGSP